MTEYMAKAKDDQAHRCAEMFGLDEKKLREMLALHLTDETIDLYERFVELKATADKKKAKTYFDSIEHKTIPPHKVMGKLDGLLRKFIISGGFELPHP